MRNIYLLVILMCISIPITSFARYFNNNEDKKNIINEQNANSRDYDYNIFYISFFIFKYDELSINLINLRYERFLNDRFSFDICVRAGYGYYGERPVDGGRSVKDEYSGVENLLSFHIYLNKISNHYIPNVSIGMQNMILKDYTDPIIGAFVGVELFHWITNSGFNINIFSMKYPIINTANRFMTDKAIFYLLNINFYEIGFSF